MRGFFSSLTIGLIIIGFVAPIAWVGAMITGFMAIGSAPAGRRPDGKRKTGGLLGGLWDDIRISTTMKACPYCKSKIMKDTDKCPNCAEWLKEADKKAEDVVDDFRELQKDVVGMKSAQEEEILGVPSKTCPECAEVVKETARICRFCRYEFWSKEEQERRDAEAAERRKKAIEEAARTLGVEQELAEELYRSAEEIPKAGWIEEAQKHIRWAQQERKDFPHRVRGHLSQAYILAEEDERLRSKILGQHRAISRRPRRASKALLTVGALLILVAAGIFGAERKGLIELSSLKEVTSLEGASKFLAIAKDKFMKLLPTSSNLMAMVVKVEANVRSGPGKQHPVKAVLPKGTYIVEKEAKGDWINFRRGETSGWIHKSLVVRELEWKKLQEEEKQRN